MKKLILPILLLAALSAKAQQPDTLINKRDLQTVQRNMLIIQQAIHKIDMSSRLRDALDSVYFQNQAILTRRDTIRKGGKK